ncbi:glycosyltransferase [Pyxidicoccus fallax]|uniref:Glycosyltransferase n=1 Tax=Pyxidicoccus fallax TaxID=394095 RepID=A0A848LLT9_9BACT|nr:nucleotide disphospho-sugar-binding domain-containing protein [Pyxidicoccus fallax]NMO18681.1 glycosyltransferase [Pyxidicoccus fallax]NPC79132.1 glycosyltransferase [Pyxidicoccus fallax]
MHAVLTNFGSMGDVLPFVALAVELRRHGHRPVLALPPAFAPLARSHGVEFVPVGADLRGAQDDITQALLVSPEHIGAADQLQTLFTPLAQGLPRMLEDLRAACVGADVLISGRVQPAARMVHDLTGIPFVSVYVEHSGSGGGHPAFLEAVRRIINPVRVGAGLPPFHNPLVDAESPQLVLYAMSQHVRPPPRDWPGHHHMVGYFFLDGDVLGWEPPAELRDILAGGEPPLFFTFGSLKHEDPDAFTELLVEAAQGAGRRAIIQRGGSGLARKPLPPGFLAVDGMLPYAWLFPRVASVVHHSGAGTCALAFRAGVPQVLVPHAYDQFLWADLAHARGCAPAPLPAAQLTAARLAEAIQESLASPRIRDAAASVGERVRTEQGLLVARQHVEALLARLGHARPSPGARPGQSAPGADDWGDAAAPGARRLSALERQRARRRDD